MKHVVLVHWNADEAVTRADALRPAGFGVTIHSDPKATPRSIACRTRSSSS